MSEEPLAAKPSLNLRTGLTPIRTSPTCSNSHGVPEASDGPSPSRPLQPDSQLPHSQHRTEPRAMMTAGRDTQQRAQPLRWRNPVALRLATLGIPERVYSCDDWSRERAWGPLPSPPHSSFFFFFLQKIWFYYRNVDMSLTSKLFTYFAVCSFMLSIY